MEILLSLPDAPQRIYAGVDYNVTTTPNQAKNIPVMKPCTKPASVT